MSINVAVLLGNIGLDPEIRTAQSGARVANLRVATSEYWTDKTTGEKREKTEWHTVVVFNQHLIDKVVEPHIRKGTKIGVQGQICTRSWEDQAGNKRYSTEIIVSGFDGRISLEGQPGGGGIRDESQYGQTRTRERQPGEDAPAASQPAPIDDDIPF